MQLVQYNPFQLPKSPQPNVDQLYSKERWGQQALQRLSFDTLGDYLLHASRGQTTQDALLDNNRGSRIQTLIRLAESTYLQAANNALPPHVYVIQTILSHGSALGFHPQPLLSRFLGRLQNGLHHQRKQAVALEKAMTQGQETPPPGSRLNLLSEA